MIYIKLKLLKIAIGVEISRLQRKEKYLKNTKTTAIRLPWFQRFKINLWLKAAINPSSRTNQFELASDPDSVS
jgi:hypothetical protein